MVKIENPGAAQASPWATPQTRTPTYRSLGAGVALVANKNFKNGGDPSIAEGEPNALKRNIDRCLPFFA